MATSIMNVRLDSETKQALDLLAREMDRPRAQLAARAIAEYVQRNAWQIAAIREGMRQLDAGESHDFVEVMEELETIIVREEAADAG
ncbi:MAG TPA: CopG family transcriptional regulator [Chloroflexota bacterium]|nr:CopG family transcriptional regulator [Chloroflexota bacterium]